ncbi:MAG: hypothetical protein AAGB93_05805 [Planctomycetota bacterium]
MSRTAVSAPVLLALVLGAALGGGAVGFVLGGSSGPLRAAERLESGPAARVERTVVRDGTPTERPADDLSLAAPAAGGRTAPAVVVRASQGADPEAMARSIRSASRGYHVDVPTGDGVIEGLVETEEHEPIAGVDVLLLPSVSDFETARKGSSGEAGDAVTRTLEDALDKAARSWAKREGLSMRTATDARGRFRFDQVPDGRFEVRAEREGWRFRMRGTEVVQPGESTTIEGRAARSVRVALSASDGTAIDEAVLFIDGSRRDEYVDWTAEDPVVVVEDAEVKITAYADLYDWPNTRGAPPSRLVSDRIPVDVASEDGAEVTLELEPRSVLLGRLLGDPKGSTSSGVFVVPLRPGETFDDTVKLNDPLSSWARSGTFTFYGLRPGPHEIGVFGEDEMPANHRTIEIVDGLNEVELEREQLDPAGCMVVRSYAPTGRRLERVRYWFEYEQPGKDPDTGWASIRANVDGVDLIDMDDFDEFDYADWPAGTRMWLMGKTDTYGQTRVEITAGQMEAELRFEPPCELEVQILGDTSIGSYRIAIYDDSIEREDPRRIAMASQGRRGSDVRIRRSGVATFRGLAPGPVVVALKHESQWWGDGVEIARQELTLVGADHRVEFQAIEVCDLVIVVTPVDSDQSFSIRKEEEDGDEQYLGWGSTTDDGRLRFRGLPPGDYVVALGEKGARLDVTLPCSEIRWDISEHVTKLTVSISKSDGKLASWGLQGGDLITAIDGEPVEESDQLLARLDEKDVTVTVERGEETLELELPRYPRKTRGENPLGGWMYISDDGD